MIKSIELIKDSWYNAFDRIDLLIGGILWIKKC